jgi:hypothetical protein
MMEDPRPWIVFSAWISTYIQAKIGIDFLGAGINYSGQVPIGGAYQTQSLVVAYSISGYTPPIPGSE